MKNNVMALVLIAVLVGGGLGFFGGMQYQKTQRPARAGTFTRPNGARGGGVSGDILSIDKNTMTVKLPNGSSKIVILSTATSINKAATGAISDLVVGTRVAVFGTANADGSVTAANVQINPVMRGPNSATNSAGY